MGVADVVNEARLAMAESQNQRDQRVETLWKKLDPHGIGELDFKGLQNGLKRLDHPLKNADEMLASVLTKVDTNGDGKIQYDEFKDFVEGTEHKLRQLYQSINRKHNGRLGKDELLAAFKEAGITVPQRKLAAFFDEIDTNHDGFITFEEWRSFLLLIPTTGDASPLEAAFSFYASTVMLNAEGDSMVTDETLEGLGTTGFLLQVLFGSILKLAQPASNPLDSLPFEGGSDPTPQDIASLSLPEAHTSAPSRINAAPSASLPNFSNAPRDDQIAFQCATDNAIQALMQAADDDYTEHANVQVQEMQLSCDHVLELDESTERGLMHYLPESGYFLAGALAGGISRTATAPLDRIKVYLIVNTSPKSTEAAKTANAAKKAARPLGAAIHELWKAGGIKTFFAGNGLNVVKIMPETAIKFGSYEAAKRALARLEGHNDVSRINPWSKFLAGGLAGMTAQFCVYPLDTLKFRMQSETIKGGLTGNALIIQTAKKMMAEGAVKTSYRGVTMGLLGMFPYSAIDMGTFELLKGTYTKYKAKYAGVHEEDAQPGNVATGIIGASSGAFGATIVYPLNVLRTRLQTQGTVMHPPTYTGIVDVAQKTWQNEGFKGLYRGLTPNLLKVAPALSITWIVYENSKKLLGLH